MTGQQTKDNRQSNDIMQYHECTSLTMDISDAISVWPAEELIVVMEVELRTERMSMVSQRYIVKNIIEKN